MTYLVHTAHAQCVGLWVGTVGSILTALTLGLIQWRIWLVEDLSVISSGVAWVGLWRVCFHSHVLVSSEFKVMFCQRLGLSEDFTPPEIAAAQVLMMLAVVTGFCGNAGAVYGLRNVYFGLEKHTPIHLTFSTAGVLCLLAAALALVPLLWNMNSVLTNQTIRFPPGFHMPPAPVEQHPGPAIGVGIVASLLLIVSGIIFLSYRLPDRTGPSVEPYPVGRCLDGSGCVTSLSCDSEGLGPVTTSYTHARENPAFQSD